MDTWEAVERMKEVVRAERPADIEDDFDACEVILDALAKARVVIPGETRVVQCGCGFVHAPGERCGPW